MKTKTHHIYTYYTLTHTTHNTQHTLRHNTHSETTHTHDDTHTYTHADISYTHIDTTYTNDIYGPYVDTHSVFITHANNDTRKSRDSLNAQHIIHTRNNKLARIASIAWYRDKTCILVIFV